jgi:hypothetical protein
MTNDQFSNPNDEDGTAHLLTNRLAGVFPVGHWPLGFGHCPEGFANPFANPPG